MLMRVSEVIAARPLKQLEPVNPEGGPGEDKSLVSGESIPQEGFVLI